MPSNTERNLLEELKEALESGNFRVNDDGSATLRGVPASVPPQSQQFQNASPVVAAAIKLPDLEPPPPKPRTPSPAVELKQTPKSQQQQFESDDEEDESEEEEESEEERPVIFNKVYLV